MKQSATKGLPSLHKEGDTPALANSLIYVKLIDLLKNFTLKKTMAYKIY